jgi:hypothetical protein
VNLRKDHYRVLAAAVASQLSSSANEQTRHHGGCGQRPASVSQPGSRVSRGTCVDLGRLPIPTIGESIRKRALPAEWRRFKEQSSGNGGPSPRVLVFCRRLLSTTVNLPLYIARPIGNRSTRVYDFRRNEIIIITLSGGSLGSCVDEERSQLREVM